MTSDKRFDENENSRVATLIALEILDTQAEPEFDRITQHTAEMMKAPIAVVSFIDEQRQWLKSCVGEVPDEIKRELSFCSHTIQSNGSMIVEDATLDPRFAANPYVVGLPHIRFYAGVPLIIDGAAIGALCVIDIKPRQISKTELASLTFLAGLVVDQIHAHRKTLLLARSEERFRLAAVASSDAMYEWDLTKDATVWAAGHGHRSVGGDIDLGDTGVAWKANIHPEDRIRITTGIHFAIDQGRFEWSDEYRLIKADGTYSTVVDRCFILRDNKGAPARVIGAMHDITAQKTAESRLHQAAYHDTLTGLPNRALFLQSLSEALRFAEEKDTIVGVIYIDLDDFKNVNDTLGHDAGDAVLVEAARSLNRCVPASAMVARLGGDEFAILLTDTVTRFAVDEIARQIVEALGLPVAYENSQLSSKASLGIAFYPLDDLRSSELVKNADLALYRAKGAGGNQHVFFSNEMRQHMQQKMSALACAREALMRDAVVPFYQPKFSLETGELYGFEALLRWTHPKRGVQSPALIKEAFEDPTLSVEIGRRMLRKVTADMQLWRTEGVPFGSIAINVAAQQLHRTDFAAEVLVELEGRDLPTNCLEIEVTESVFLGDGSDGVGNALRNLHHAGVTISLDDFGTGYASLTHLNKFPLSWIKIDQSFVRDMDSPDSAAIVDAIVGLAHNLGIRVVAEGIETPEQWDQLKCSSADLGQGYLMAKPMSGPRVPHFIRSWTGPLHQRADGRQRYG